jgi:sigma-B regulation protein RsbU (phosphoserine phosphatase)
LADIKSLASKVDWQSELTRIATKHHVIVCWVAIFLNPIWFIADYFTIPAYWKIFFVLRMIVTAVTLLAVLIRKRINLSTELLMLIPVLGISLQNAYMWSVMDVPMLQKHAFAYIALFIGAGMLVLWKPIWSIGVVVASLIVNIICFHLYSALTVQEILINGGMLVLTVAIMSVVLIQARYSLTKKEIIARLALVETNKELAIQKDLIEEKNKEITDSINYAKRIQQAKLPAREEISASLPQSFVLYKPKSIVSGDFYFFHRKGKLAFIASADCTGHGVPGAFMSMIGSEVLDDAVSQSSDTSEILKLLNRGIRTSLHQSESDESTRDGMDIALCSIDTERRVVKFAGANRPLWIIRDGQSVVEEIKATKHAIGGFTHDSQVFESHEVALQPNDTVYIATDGYADTFSGKNSKKLTTKKFKEILVSMQDKPMSLQEKILDDYIEQWKDGTEQVDDILVIGVRL